MQLLQRQYIGIALAQLKPPVVGRLCTQWAAAADAVLSAERLVVYSGGEAAAPQLLYYDIGMWFLQWMRLLMQRPGMAGGSCAVGASVKRGEAGVELLGY